MSPRFTFRWVRGVISGLLLASGAIAFESLATPVITGGGENSLVAPRRDDLLRPLPAPPIDEIRVDEAVPGRRSGPDGTLWDRLGASPGLPGNYGSGFGQGDTLRNQLLRDFGNASANPAGAPAAGWERGRSGGTSELGRGGSDYASPAQAAYREAVDNALKLVRDSVLDETDSVSFSMAGVDFSLTLGGGRRSLTVNGSDLWPASLLGGLWTEEARPESSMKVPATVQGQGIQSAAAGERSAQATATSQDSGGAQGAPLIIEKVREFLTDPMTIVVALGGLIIWLSFEMSAAVRERRRRRRSQRAQRREARAHA
jgi:hypothetical protein